MNREERGPWYLITALVIGIGAGLFYAWILAPVTFIDIAPVSLREEYKEQYRVLIAAAYAANNDLARARARLDQLEDPDIVRTLTMQAQRSLITAGQENISHSLGMLALALTQEGPAVQPLPVVDDPPDEELNPTPLEELDDTPTETPLSASPTQPPPQTPSTFNISNTNPSPTSPASTLSPNALAPSITPLPSLTPTSTPGAPFVLRKDVSLTCSPKQTRPLIIVEAYDASGNPVPGLQVLVQWLGGEDRFYTGLKSEKGPGYGDFTMTPGITYTLRMIEGSQPVQGLIANECRASGSSETYWGSWHLIYDQR